MAGSCKDCDESSGSSATELVTPLTNFTFASYLCCGPSKNCLIKPNIGYISIYHKCLRRLLTHITVSKCLSSGESGSSDL
jgi:hypothetical protein